jgi:hypothetical protein
MTAKERIGIIGDVAHISLIIGECSFIGIAIGAIIADHPFVSRLILVCGGVLVSAVSFFVYVDLNHLTRK